MWFNEIMKRIIAFSERHLDSEQCNVDLEDSQNLLIPNIEISTCQNMFGLRHFESNSADSK